MKHLGEVLDLDALWSPLARPRDEPVRDWIGNRWNPGSFPALPSADTWFDPVTPHQGDGFRAGAAEWAGFALAVHLAQASGHRRMVELGASQAPWCLSWVRALTGLSAGREGEGIRAVAVEAGAGTEAARVFWDQQGLGHHTEVHGEDLEFHGSGWTVEWRRRAVVAGGGSVFFPRVDIRADNGAQVVGDDRSRDYRGMEVEHEEVRGVDLRDLVAELAPLTLLHADLQGAEAALMASGSFASLEGQVSVLLLGTHSRAVEQEAMERMTSYGFALLAETPCVVAPSDDGLSLLTDGEQLWIAGDAVARAQELGVLSSDVQPPRRVEPAPDIPVTGESERAVSDGGETPPPRDRRWRRRRSLPTT